MGQHRRVLDCLRQYANGEGASQLTEARTILRALDEAETSVLFPAFSRVQLRLETERLLEDSRGNRAEQLALLDVLAHKRAARSRKLAAVELYDLIEHHAEQEITLLIPVLASQLPRALYRSIVHVFTDRFQGQLDHGLQPRQPRRARTMISNA